ncbi:trypsin-like serine protease [Bdellovibrio sp. HCB2-146]|uniref:trypsin-like serine protease n=1 Tax=Bdellovibrio sp. HCB2-146 TaxID=3394362 RepID=UPI0039BC9B17
MNFRNFLTTLTLLMASSSAFSISGNSAMDLIAGGPQGVCRILMYNEENNFNGICTGTLVTPTKVLTAAHCLPAPNNTIKVECGYQGYESKNFKIDRTKMGSKVYTSGVYFKETAMAEPFFSYPKRDQAVIKLDRPLSIKPIPLSKEALVTPDSECILSGFGRTNSGFSGILVSGKINDIGENEQAFLSFSLATVLGLTAINIPENGGLQTILAPPAVIDHEETFNAHSMPGDSGGPMLCRGADGQWNLMGVNNYLRFNVNMKQLPPVERNRGKPQVTMVFTTEATHVEAPVRAAITSDIAPTGAFPTEEKSTTFRLRKGSDFFMRLLGFVPKQKY